MIRTTRYVALSFVALVLAACSEAPTTPAAQHELSGPSAFTVQAAAEQVMEGEVIVKLRGGADVADVARRHGLALGYAGRGNAFFVLRGNAGAEHGNAAALRGDDAIE